MRRRPTLSRLALVMSVMVVSSTALVASVVVAQEARTSVPGGMCSLWTERQVSRAMRETMAVVRDDPDACVWYGKATRSGSISTASVSLWGGDPTSADSFLEQARRSGPQWASEIEVAGTTALATSTRRAGQTREITMAAFPDAVTWMNVRVTSQRGKDARTAATRLIELGAAKLTPMTTASTTPSSIPGPSASPSIAPPPDAIPGHASLCELLTTDEVAAALGDAPIEVVGDHALNCVYSAETSGDADTSLIVVAALGAPATGSNLDTAKGSYPDATLISVGDAPALLLPATSRAAGHTTMSLHVFPDAATWLILDGSAVETVDLATTLPSLAALAVDRIAAAAPSPGPSASATAGGVVGALGTEVPEVLFPATIGGSPVTLQEIRFDSVSGFLTTEEARAMRRIERRLEAAGRSRSDVRLAAGQPASQAAVILVVHAPDVEMAPLVASFMVLMGMSEGRGTPAADLVAGKDVTPIVVGGAPGYAYVRGDTVWYVVVQGDDALMTEIMAALP